MNQKTKKRAIGVDAYNQSIAGEKSKALTASATDSDHIPIVVCENQAAKAKTVVLEGNGQRPSHHGDGYKESNIMYTLNTTEIHAVAYGFDRATYNQSPRAKFDFMIDEEKIGPLLARGPGGVFQPVREEESNGTNK